MREDNENLAQLNARGEYELVEPFDTKLMEILPDEGTLFANLYPLGETAATLAKKLSTKDAVVPSSAVSMRLRILNQQGLVVKKKSISTGGGRAVWQRTKTAAALLGQKKEQNGGGFNGESG